MVPSGKSNAPPFALGAAPRRRTVRGAAIEDGKKEEIEMPFESFAAHTLQC